MKIACVIIPNIVFLAIFKPKLYCYIGETTSITGKGESGDGAKLIPHTKGDNKVT